MTIRRDLDYLEEDNGEAWAGHHDDTVNHLFGLQLGILQNAAGTNTYTAELSNQTGFNGLTSGCMAVFKAPANNTGASTLRLESSTESPSSLTADLAIRDKAGVALTADALVSGSKYILSYDSDDGYWRVLA